MSKVKDIKEEEYSIHSIEKYDVGTARVKIELELDVDWFKLGFEDKLRRDRIALDLRSGMEDFARRLLNELQSKVDREESDHLSE